MFSIVQNVINLSSGNAESYDIPIYINGVPYELAPGDKLIFALKKRTSDTEELLHKEFVTRTVVFDPVDTANLQFGKYIYDVTLILADGRPKTIVGPTDFNILEVVRNG